MYRKNKEPYSQERKRFYNSTMWRNITKYVWLKQNCLCYKCGQPVYIYGISDPNTSYKRRGIIHHKEHLTEVNLADENIALNEENLVGLCVSCHSKAHAIGQGTRKGYTFDEEGNLIKSDL